MQELYLPAHFFMLIDDAPTVETKKGEWILDTTIQNIDYKLARCSNCGYRFGYAIAKVAYKYCPNCGADMRGNNIN